MIALLISPPALTTARYDEIMARLDRAGAASPPGRRAHICFGTGPRLQTLDIWDTEEHLRDFLDLLWQVEAAPGQLQVLPVHNLLLPG
jgi:hypothetical protein